MHSEEPFEDELAALFDAAPAMDDEDVFARRVAARIARVQRTQRWVFGTAYVLGGAIAAIEIGRWSGWSQMGRWADAGVSTLSNPAMWASMTPTVALAWSGAAALVVYVGVQLRQSR